MIKNVIDNKKFWKTVKPSLSDKSIYRQKINLIENEKALTSKFKTAESLYNFFSNIVRKLEIPKFDSKNSVTENIKNPVFKATLKCEKHPSILAIQKYNKNKIFHFKEVKNGETKKEILEALWYGGMSRCPTKSISFLQKATTCIGLQIEQMLSVNF